VARRSRAELIANVLPIEKKFFALAERYVNAADDDVANLARALFVHHQHFFSFVHEDGVDPTNKSENAAGGICDRMPRAGLCRVLHFSPGRIASHPAANAA
jgi:hypothetical protein